MSREQKTPVGSKWKKKTGTDDGKIFNITIVERNPFGKLVALNQSKTYMSFPTQKSLLRDYEKVS